MFSAVNVANAVSAVSMEFLSAWVSINSINRGCHKSATDGGLPERGSQRLDAPHGSSRGANGWETVPPAAQSTRGGPEAVPSSSDRVLVSYWPLADLYNQSLQKITQRRGARTSSTAAAPGRIPGTHPTSSRFRTWPRARGTRGRGRAASSTAGRTSRMSRTRSRSSPPPHLRARSFHPATFGAGR